MVRDSQTVQHGAGLGLRFCPRTPAMHHRFVGRPVRSEVRCLCQIGDADIPALDHGSLIRLQNACRDLQQGGLSCPIDTDQADPITAADSQRQVREQLMRPVVFRDMFKIQYIHSL